VKDESLCAFEEAAREHREGGLLGEWWGFLRHNKKWWLLLVFFLFGMLLWLSGSGAGPFLYTLF
jgi:hypothetical protein